MGLVEPQGDESYPGQVKDITVYLVPEGNSLMLAVARRQARQGRNLNPCSVSVSVFVPRKEPASSLSPVLCVCVVFVLQLHFFFFFFFKKMYLQDKLPEMRASTFLPCRILHSMLYRHMNVSSHIERSILKLSNVIRKSLSVYISG
jgi:hypothetical protein